MKEYTLKDIEEMAVIVQLNGNCHQVLISPENKEILKVFISGMTNGLRLSDACEPITFTPLQAINKAN